MEIPRRLYTRASIARAEDRALTVDDLEMLPGIERSAAAQQELQSAWSAATRCAPQSAPVTLWSVIAANYRAELFLGAFLRLVGDIANVGLALVLRQLIIVLEDHESPDVPGYTGYLYALGLTMCNILSIGALAASNEVTLGMFQRIRSALTCMIFDKTLRLDTDHGKQGAIVGMHSTDMAKFRELQFIHGMVVAPIALVLNMAALYVMVGPAGLSAVATITFLMLVQSQLTSRTGSVIHHTHKFADARLKAISEAVLGIKVLKFMNWEDKIIERIEAIRSREVKELKKLYIYRAIITGISHSMHMLLLLTVFGIAHAASAGVSASAVFPAMALLNSLRHTINSFAMGLGKILDLRVTFRRLDSFLSMPEKEIKVLPLLDATVSPSGAAIVLRACDLTIGFLSTDGDFTPLVKEVNLDVEEGQLVVVIGGTGSGKSALVTALIGEARVAPESRVYAAADKRVAWVAQEAWMMNATIRDNILMGRSFEEKRYSQVIAACQLSADLDHLPGGDMTEIGERGINLSGGQKQRISLARAVYSDRDIIVMDDVMSALDAHVGRAIFEDCICGVLANKTRILVTHQSQFIPFADRVVVMRNCQMIFSGSYDEFAGDTPLHSLSGFASPKAAGKAGSGAGGFSSVAGSARAATPTARTGEASSIGSPGPTTAGVLRGSTVPSSASAVPNTGARLIMDEEQNVGSISTEVYKWIVDLSGPWRVIAAVVVFTIWRTALIFVDVWLGLWSDKRGGFGRDAFSEAEYFQWFAVLTCIGVFFVVMRQLFFNFCLFRLVERIHRTMLVRLMTAPMSFFDCTPLGRLLNRFSKDLRVLDVVISEFFMYVLLLIFLSAGYIAVICASAVYMIVPVIFLAFGYSRLNATYTNILRAVKRVENVERSSMMATMSESVGGLVTLRAYGLGPQVALTHARRVDGMMRALYNARASTFAVMIAVGVMSSIIIFSASILAVVFVTNSDAAVVSPGQTYVILGLSYSTALTTVFGFLLILAAEVDSSMSAAERMMAYATDLPQEPDFDEYGSGPESDAPPPPPANWPRSGSIVVDSVSLRYRDGLPFVLRDVSFKVKSGERVGICGRTGSGKSTLMLALFRLVEVAHGAIYFDDVNIAHLRLCDLRKQITIIPQDPVMFGGDIRSNLDPFHASTDDELVEVLGKVGMWKRLADDGLRTVVDEKGSNFSVGERQLLCLARAMLKRSRVLLLDEASASVSGESDELIQQVIRTEFHDCTVITIAHRLSTVIDSDKILVMSDGCPVEFDHPKVLLDDPNGIFFGMIAQLGDQLPELYNAANTAFNAKRDSGSL